MYEQAMQAAARAHDPVIEHAVGDDRVRADQTNGHDAAIDVDVDDAGLARALMAGRPWAARVAWQRFSPMVRRILARTFGPRQDIDDVHQDVFLSFFRKVPELRQPESLKAFVVSIAVRTIKHELRSRRTRRFFHLADDQMIPDARFTEQPDAAARQALTAFYGILDRLPAADQAAFSLRFFEGLELPDVARALNVSVSTAKRRLARVWRLVTARVRRNPAAFAYLGERRLLDVARSSVVPIGGPSDPTSLPSPPSP